MCGEHAYYEYRFALESASKPPDICRRFSVSDFTTYARGVFVIGFYSRCKRSTGNDIALSFSFSPTLCLSISLRSLLFCRVRPKQWRPPHSLIIAGFQNNNNNYYTCTLECQLAWNNGRAPPSGPSNSDDSENVS